MPGLLPLASRRLLPSDTGSLRSRLDLAQFLGASLAAATASGSITLGGTGAAAASASATGTITLDGSSAALASATAGGSISLGGTATATGPAGAITVRASLTAQAAGSTSLVQAVPTWAAGDLLVWLVGNAATATPPPTPTGWTLIQSGTTTAAGATFLYRWASAEPASYTATVANRSASVMASFSGVDATTPIDVTTPAAGAGTTAFAFPAITPVTAGAVILAALGFNVASGVINTTLSSSNLDAIVDQISSQSGTATNHVVGLGRALWSGSGSFTPGMTSSNTSVRSIAMTAALRPAAGGGATAATAAGSITLSGAPTATAQSTAGGILSLGGAVAASAVATSTGTITLGGTGTGAALGVNTAAGSITLAGTAAAAARPTAAGTVTLGGSVTAQARATSTGTVTLGGSATARVTATAAGLIFLSGLATGQATSGLRDITISVTAGRSRTLTATGASRAFATAGRSRALTVNPRE